LIFGDACRQQRKAAMPNDSASRFRFVGHALAGDGPFRPVVTRDATTGQPYSSGPSYLDRYPRETDEKYASRNGVAFYASPLAQAASRFVGYVSTKPAVRKFPHALYEGMEKDIDGKGNSLGVFFQQFLANAKSRGSLCMLVDMDAIPQDVVPNQAAQIAGRVAPYWSIILPELITDYELGDDGKFTFAEFSGTFKHPTGKREACTWRFDRSGWMATADAAAGKSKVVLSEGTHNLGECPIIIWTEGGDFPHFGPFAAIADLARRLFNAESELDEIIRSVTFPMLTMNVEAGTTEAQKLTMAATAGQTIGSGNLLVHSGTTPSYIAPPNGPAEICIKRIDMLRAQINEIGLSVATINEQESGIAMQMRFQAINAELVRAAERTEDFERRAWALSAKWLGMNTAPETEWSRDYNMADIEREMQILADMQAAAMPQEIIRAQQERIVKIQFGNLEQAEVEDLISALDEQQRGIQAGNVVPLPDRNAPVRDSIMRALNG
jgi:hypothetical protein